MKTKWAIFVILFPVNLFTFCYELYIVLFCLSSLIACLQLFDFVIFAKHCAPHRTFCMLRQKRNIYHSNTLYKHFIFEPLLNTFLYTYQKLIAVELPKFWFHFPAVPTIQWLPLTLMLVGAPNSKMMLVTGIPWKSSITRNVIMVSVKIAPNHPFEDQK